MAVDNIYFLNSFLTLTDFNYKTKTVNEYFIFLLSFNVDICINLTYIFCRHNESTYESTVYT